MDQDFSPSMSATRILRQAMRIDVDRPVAQRDMSEIERAATHTLVGLATTQDLRSYAANWFPAIEWVGRQVAQHYQRVPSPGKSENIFMQICQQLIGTVLQPRRRETRDWPSP